MLPIIGIVVLAAIVLSSASSKEEVPRRIGPFFETRKKGLLSRLTREGPSLVSFTERKVPWKRSRLPTGEIGIVYRTVIEEDPRDVQARISRALGREVDLDAVILATMIASEVGDKKGREHPVAKAAIGHAALTEAKLRRRTLMKQLIPDGRFGDQLGRYASTRLPPTSADIEMAEGILSGKVGTPTPGATNWDSPQGQRAAIRARLPGYEGRTPDVIAERRESDGKEPVYVPGVDPDYLRLWRPKQDA